MFLDFIRKLSLYRMKTYGAIIASLTIPSHAAAESAAIIGGIDLTGTGPAYAALVSSSVDVTPLALPGDAAMGGIITSVSMNSSGNSLIGGQGQTGSAYAALISSSGMITPLVITGPTVMHGIIYSAAINSHGNGIIGGRDTTGPIYAALVPPLGNPLVPLVFSDPIASGGIINSVSINDSGNGLIGGQGFYDAQPAYAASASPSGVLTPLTLTGGVATHGTISSVVINSSGNGIIGGQDLTGFQPAYAALVSSSGTVSPLALTGGMSTSGEILSVAINSSGNSIIGGQDLTGSQAAYTALVSPSGTVTPLTLAGGVTTNGIINNVAINSSGNSIIGGQDLTGSQPAYAALISASGTVTPLVLGSDMDTNGIIYSAAINDEGNGLIGGWNLIGSQPGYAALVSSSGTVTPLTLTGGITINGWINSVALLPLSSLLRKIPTTSLSGNNLIFANYINEFASKDAFYFIPSVLNETLNAALQSAAPTRNGISIYIASCNLFNLTTSFANHIRNQQSEKSLQQKKSIAVTENKLPCEELLTSLSIQKKPPSNSLLGNPFSIWFETVGALAYQKSQHQTVSFSPTIGGAILGLDYMIMPELRVGGGISYLFTHIHEKEDQGHGNINQEEGFIYSSWDNQQFYVDILVMGGGVQIDQVRNTKMTSFSFRSSCHPNGWQFLPHLELGLKKNIMNQSKTNNFCLNPFAMLDWANAWQESYQEKGDSPFNAAQKAYYGSLLRTEAGLRLYETFFFQSWNLGIQEKISYVNTQSFNAGKVNAFLVGSSGSFTVETLSSAQNLGVGQLAISFDPLNACYPTSTLFYQGEFGRQYQSHQLNLELAWQF
jgi:uncharacterized protein with beta-barrel porin domain